MKGTATPYQKAIQLLARRAHSRTELKAKLGRKTQLSSEADLEKVLDRLEREGYLDDYQFALQRGTSLRTRRNWGNLRISRDLKRHGINATMISRILEEVQLEKSESESLEEIVQAWIQRSGRPAGRSQLKKLYDHCLRLGFDPSAVRGALEPLFQHLT